jgi:hypothetical protein
MPVRTAPAGPLAGTNEKRKLKRNNRPRNPPLHVLHPQGWCYDLNDRKILHRWDGQRWIDELWPHW